MPDDAHIQNKEKQKMSIACTNPLDSDREEKTHNLKVQNFQNPEFLKFKF